MKVFIIYPVVFFFLHTSPAIQVTVDKYETTELQSVYLIKQYWHTALVFTPDQIDEKLIPEIKLFSDFKLVDFGWGDEEFYQYPGFDSGLAFSALFYATPSTLRVEGIFSPKEVVFEHYEIVIELKVDAEQLEKLNEYISFAFYRDEKDEPVMISESASGKIIFFKANESYHLFNTCNTWVAEGLSYAGFDLETNIILAEQLFNEAAKIGTVLKAPDQ